MSKSKSLNPQIAEALGYKAVKAQKRTNYWQLVTKKRLPVSVNLYPSEEEAFADAPDFEHSLDAVLDALPPAFKLVVEAEYTYGEYVARGYFAHIIPVPFLYRVADEDDQFHGKGDTRQQAAANALLEYCLWKA